MKGPIGILYIASRDDLTGGGGVGLLNYLQNLDRARFAPMVICPSIGALTNAAKEIGVKTKVIETKSLKGMHLISFVSATIKLLRVIREHKINVVHSNAGASRESFYAVTAAAIGGVPFIYHARVIESAGLIEKILVSLAAKIIIISDAVAEKYCWLKNRKKLVKIHNAVDLKKFNTEIDGEKIRNEFGITPATFLIGVVGNLIPWKGHEYFLKAAREIKSEEREIKFIIAGRDLTKNKSHEKRLKRLVEKLKIGDNVIFTDFRRDIPQLMAAIDVLVLPSLGEPFGRVIIEAMALAKPVVATSSGGVPEIVENGRTGFLVPTKNPRAISEAVMKLLNDKKLSEEMGARGRKRAEDLFDIKKNITHAEDLYDKLLKAGAKR